MYDIYSRKMRHDMDIKLNYISKIAYVAILLLVAIFQGNICLAAKTSKPAIVYMYDKYFDPSTITISPGQKVIWINKGELDHTVTSNNGYFDSGRVHPGSRMSYTFTKPGTYSYKCTIHSLMLFGMTGKVIVK